MIQRLPDSRQMRNDQVVRLVEFPEADVEEKQEKENKTKPDGRTRKYL